MKHLLVLKAALLIAFTSSSQAALTFTNGSFNATTLSVDISGTVEGTSVGNALFIVDPSTPGIIKDTLPFSFTSIATGNVSFSGTLIPSVAIANSNQIQISFNQTFALQQSINGTLTLSWDLPIFNTDSISPLEVYSVLPPTFSGSMLQGSFTPVPEPTSILLLGLASFGIIFKRRR